MRSRVQSVRDAHDRLDIREHGAGRAVREDRQLLVADLRGEHADLVHHPGPRAGQSEVRRHDSQIRHEVEQPLLDLERRVPHRGRLQAVAQRLVVQIDPGTGPVEGGLHAIPVIDQLALVHPLVSPRQ